MQSLDFRVLVVSAGAVIALLLSAPLMSDNRTTSVGDDTEPACATCTTDWTASGQLSGANMASPANQSCYVAKLTANQTGCGKATPNDITFRARNLDATDQRARLVVYADDGTGNDPGALIYKGGCFYDTDCGSSGFGCDQDAAGRTWQACTDDGEGTTMYDFDCADTHASTPDVRWVGACFEQASVVHMRTGGASSGTGDLVARIVGAGVFDTPPASFGTPDDEDDRQHYIVVDW